MKFPMKSQVLRAIDHCGFKLVRTADAPNGSAWARKPNVVSLLGYTLFRKSDAERGEADLKRQIEAEPARLDLLEQLTGVLATRGEELPPDLRENMLSLQLEKAPERDGLREALEFARYKQGKLSRERTNEITLEHWRKRDFAPGNIMIQLTDECNLSCAMCPHHTASKTRSFMDETLFRTVLDRAAERKVGNLVFATGYGDALLHPKALDYIKESMDRGFHVTVSTNGNYLKPDQIDRLAALNMEIIQYSFFGYDALSYEQTYVGGKFESASENLRLLKAALVRHRTRTRLQVHGVNLANDTVRSDRTRAFLSTIGIEDNEIMISVATNFGGKKAQGKYYSKINGKSNKPLDEMELYLCPLLLSSPGVLVDGRVTACGCVDNNGSLTVGDVRNNSLKEVFEGEAYQSLIAAFLAGDLSKHPMCERCDTPYGNINGTLNRIPAKH